MPLREILLALCRREDLSREQARDAFEIIMSGGASEAEIGGLLIGMAAKGTTVDELVGAATVMREKVIPVPVNPAWISVDTCGTGGDVRHTFNISTAAALIAAGAGVKVVKHGNRSASGKSGSADVLEKLGVKIDAGPDVLHNCLAQANICFAFARTHHPAMKFVGEARKSIGIPTIFNLLGPLTNPGQAKHQLLGVFAPELTERMALVLRELGSQRAWVVHAKDGLDELSTMSRTRISELRDGNVKTWMLEPEGLGLARAKLEDLQVQSVDEAAEALREILRGDRGPRREIALLNAAGSLVVAGLCEDMPQGLIRAADALDSGAAQDCLEQLIRLSQGQS